jgi:TPR repeat protein
LTARITLLSPLPSLEVDGKELELPTIGTRGLDLLTYLAAHPTPRLLEEEVLISARGHREGDLPPHRTHRVAIDVCPDSRPRERGVRAIAPGGKDLRAALSRLSSIKSRLPPALKRILKSGTAQLSVAGPIGDRVEKVPTVALAGVTVDILEFHERVAAGDFARALRIVCAADEQAIRPFLSHYRPRPDWLAELQADYYDEVSACLEGVVHEIMDAQVVKEPQHREWNELARAVRLNTLRNAVPAEFDYLCDRPSVSAAERQLYELLRSAQPTMPKLRLGSIRPLTEDDWEKVGVQRNVAGLAELADEPGNSLRPYAESFPPAIKRSKGDQLDQRIRDAITSAGPPFVVVRGTAGAGKTRLLFDRILASARDHPVITPKSRTDLSEALVLVRWLASGEGDPASGDHAPVPIIWLEDLEVYAGDFDSGSGIEHGLTPVDLVDLDSPRTAIIVATAGGKGLAHLPSAVAPPRRTRASDITGGNRLATGPGSPAEISSAYFQLLEGATIVELDAELDGSEFADAVSKYGDEIAARFRAEGPGAYFIAARRLMDHYAEMRRSRPQAGAIVDCAIAWRRLGIDEPLPEQLLRFLWERQQMGVRPTRRTYERAIDDACEALPHIPTVRPVTWGDKSITPHDYLARNAPPTASMKLDTIDALVPHTNGRQSVLIGQTIALKLADSRERLATEEAAEVARAAVTAYRHGAELDVPVAAANLGTLLWTLDEVRDLPGAVAAYERGTELGSALAATNLGLLRSQEEEVLDLEGAVAAFERGIELGDAGAAFRLGNLLQRDTQLRNVSAAIEAYERSIALGDTSVWLNLGLIFWQEPDVRDIPRAVAAFESAVEAGHEEGGWLGLGMLLEAERGDLQGALHAFRRSADIGSGIGADYVGLLLSQHDAIRDIPAAIIAFERAIELGFAESGKHLGTLLRTEPDFIDFPRAIAAYRRGMELGSGSAAHDLGVLLLTEPTVHDRVEAAAAFRRGLELGDADSGMALGQLLSLQVPMVRSDMKLLDAADRLFAAEKSAPEDEELRDLPAAAAAYRQAVELGSGQPRRNAFTEYGTARPARGGRDSSTRGCARLCGSCVQPRGDTARSRRGAGPFCLVGSV